MRVGRSAVGVALVLAATTAAGVLALGATIGTAATPLPTLTLNVVPQPTVATSQNVLGILKFSYPANASPTTLTGVYVEVTITPALSSPADFNGALSSSFCALQGLSVVRCNLGIVRTGQARTMFVVVSASSTPGSISMAGAAFWNENVNGKNPQLNNMIESDTVSTSVVSGTANANGKCTVGGSTLETGMQLGAGNQIVTQLSYPANSQGLPCTPASVQDDIVIEVTNAVCVAFPCVGALVTLPQLPSPATMTITFDGSLFPPPGPAPNPNTFVVYEIVTGTLAEPVPFCSTGMTTSFGTCEVGAVKFGVRGIQVTLLVPGSGIDPNYFG